MKLRSRAIRTGAAVAVLCALTPATASAGEMTHDALLGSLTYKSAPGEANVVEASMAAGVLTLTDTGASSIDTFAAALVCAPAVGTTVTCTPAPGTALKFDGDDGGDAISFTGTEAVKLVGGAGDDVLSGGDGSDRLVGDDGDDRFIGGAGADRFDGGAGRDMADYSSATEAVTVTPGDGADDGTGGEADEVRYDVESSIGGTGGDTLTAGREGGTLTGGDGDDVLTGGPGLDAFDGGAANDRVVADDANAETIACGDGLDEIRVDPRDVVAEDCETKTVIVPPVVAEPTTTTTTTTSDTTTAVEAPKAPKMGKSVVVKTGKGTIRVKGPNGEYVTLDETDEIPVGSTVDAREGSVTLTAEARAGGVLQTARFTGGVFTVQQLVDVRPVTELYLTGGSFRNCPRVRRRARGAARASGVARDPARRAVRSLWGNGHGSFRTVGRYSAASVRGTIWHTVDRCDGTVTTVRRGVVRVADFGRNRFVTVRTGDSYLARARRR